MKPSSHSSLLALALLLGTLTLVGCGGALNFPDSVTNTQATGASISGVVYGGHAPIQGQHVYLLQPGTTGYGSAATDILETGTENTSDPNVPVGAKYVTTDSTGSFNTGPYACAVGQPVYLYAWGGNIGTTTGTSTTSYTISQIVVSGRTTGAGGRATYTATISAGATPTVGESVTIAGLANDFTILNAAQTVTAVPSSTTFSFVATDYYATGGIFGGHANLADGTYSTRGGTNFGTGGTVAITTSATNPATNNSAIVQLATLGNCPESGNFYTSGDGALSFIYMNEVSTIATAYTFQPFTLATQNDAWHIGTSGTTQALVGIANAADTAAQLYNIEGGTQLSTSGDGEGHPANYQTQGFDDVGGTITLKPSQGNGIVPQATIDSLANIIATCVDSTPASGGGLSAPCTALFKLATNNGETGTTANEPTDTGTAAINIARYPAGNNSTGTVDANYARDIYALQTGVTPYVPQLNSAPHDWTLAIDYPYTAVSGYASATNPLLAKAESIAVDDIGQIWITAQGSAANGADASVVRWSHLGVQNFNYSAGYIYGYISIDGGNNAWAGNGDDTAGTGIEEFNNNGDLVNTWGSGYGSAYTVIANDTGNAYFFASDAAAGDYDTYGNFEMFEYNSGGTLVSGSATCDGHNAAFVYDCISQAKTTIITAGDNVAHGAIDAAGDFWLTSETAPYQIARVTPAGASVFSIDAPAQQPEFPSIDHNGDAWIALQETASEIVKVTNPATGAHTNLTSGTTGAELTSTFGSAVDGNGNVWFTNRCGNYGNCGTTAGRNSIVEINGATDTAISPPTNYVPEAQYPATSTTLTTMLDDSLNLAIDPSGNVWITNYLGSAVVELVGAAAPVVTPLSVAAGNNQLGTKP